MYQFQLYFDGGCKPNPGEGYGSYEVRCPKHGYQTKRELIQFGFMTSNMAEYHAFLHGVKKLWHDSRNGSVRDIQGAEIKPGRINLDIKSDSMLFVQQMNGRWKCKVAHILELIEESRLVLKEFGHWKLSWHSRRRNVERFGH